MRLTHDQFNLWKSYKIRGYRVDLEICWHWTPPDGDPHGPFPTRQEAILDCMKQNPIKRKVGRRQK